MPKSAWEKMREDKSPKVVVLEKDFADMKKGQRMFVGTPKIVDAYIKKIPHGKHRNIIRMRREMARKEKCDVMCPVSTAIFIRLAAQAAIEEMEQGKSVDQVTPFWRLLTAKDKITKRLTIEPEWVDLQRALEES